MKSVRAILIDDSALMRIMISDVLRADPEINLIGSAKNGKEGVELARSVSPDVIISDVLMPDYDGLYVVDEIMKHSPLPVILLSSLNKNENLIFEGLNRGAFHFVEKPKNDSPQLFKKSLGELITLVKLAAGTDRKLESYNARKVNHHVHTFDVSRLPYKVIVIGASTGGPGALETLLMGIPSNLPIPIILVQHMPAHFLVSYATRISDLIPHDVILAEDSTVLEEGKIYVTSGDSNLRLSYSETRQEYQFERSEEKFDAYNNPSIDCMMESVCRLFPGKVIGVVLTGMGRDGTAGLGCIKNNGGLTITQRADTCVVDGMPKSARQKGYSMYELAPQEIPGFIMSSF